MAYDKIIPIHVRLDNCIRYALNHKKTDMASALAYITREDKTLFLDGSGNVQHFETAINCTLETAYKDMQDTKARWGKLGGNRVQGYHLIHSYVPGEVTPEQAHAAGVELANRLLGERYEAVVSTHIDRDHLHCHIVFNSVSCLDGKMYRNNFKDYFGDIRGISNDVSRDYGLSVIEPSENPGGKHYSEWEAERQGKPTIRGIMRQDIDTAIQRAYTYQTFLGSLRAQGYEVKSGANLKHTAIKPPGGKRFLRLDSLGEGYSEADIKDRLAKGREEPQRGNDKQDCHFPMVISPLPSGRYRIKKRRFNHRAKRGSVRALYHYYLYLLSGPQHRHRAAMSVYQRKELLKFRRYQEQTRLLQSYRINTTDDLLMLEEAIQAQIDSLTDQRKKLYYRKRVYEDMRAVPEIEAINVTLRNLRKKLRLCIRIGADIPRIKAELSQVERSEDEKDRQGGPAPHHEAGRILPIRPGKER